MTINVSL